MNKQTYSLLINLRDSNVLLRNIGIENKTSVKLHHYYYFKLINYKNFCFFFFLNNPPPPEIYPLPLHAALPICRAPAGSKICPPRYSMAHAASRAVRRHRNPARKISAYAPHRREPASDVSRLILARRS